MGDFSEYLSGYFRTAITLAALNRKTNPGVPGINAAMTTNPKYVADVINKIMNLETQLQDPHSNVRANVSAVAFSDKDIQTLLSFESIIPRESVANYRQAVSIFANPQSTVEDKYAAQRFIYYHLGYISHATSGDDTVILAVMLQEMLKYHPNTQAKKDTAEAIEALLYNKSLTDAQYKSVLTFLEEKTNPYNLERTLQSAFYEKNLNNIVKYFQQNAGMYTAEELKAYETVLLKIKNGYSLTFEELNILGDIPVTDKNIVDGRVTEDVITWNNIRDQADIQVQAIRNEAYKKSVEERKVTDRDTTTVQNTLIKDIRDGGDRTYFIQPALTPNGTQIKGYYVITDKAGSEITRVRLDPAQLKQFDAELGALGNKELETGKYSDYATIFKDSGNMGTLGAISAYQQTTQGDISRLADPYVTQNNEKSPIKTGVAGAWATFRGFLNYEVGSVFDPVIAPGESTAVNVVSGVGSAARAIVNTGANITSPGMSFFSNLGLGPGDIIFGTMNSFSRVFAGVDLETRASAEGRVIDIIDVVGSIATVVTGPVTKALGINLSFGGKAATGNAKYIAEMGNVKGGFATNTDDLFNLINKWDKSAAKSAAHADNLMKTGGHAGNLDDLFNLFNKWDDGLAGVNKTSTAGQATTTGQTKLTSWIDRMARLDFADDAGKNAAKAVKGDVTAGSKSVSIGPNNTGDIKIYMDSTVDHGAFDLSGNYAKNKAGIDVVSGDKITGKIPYSGGGGSTRQKIVENLGQAASGNPAGIKGVIHSIKENKIFWVVAASLGIDLVKTGVEWGLEKPSGVKGMMTWLAADTVGQFSQSKINNTLIAFDPTGLAMSNTMRNITADVVFPVAWVYANRDPGIYQGAVTKYTNEPLSLVAIQTMGQDVQVTQNAYSKYGIVQATPGQSFMEKPQYATAEGIAAYLASHPKELRSAQTYYNKYYERDGTLKVDPGRVSWTTDVVAALYAYKSYQSVVQKDTVFIERHNTIIKQVNIETDITKSTLLGTATAGQLPAFWKSIGFNPAEVGSASVAAYTRGQGALDSGVKSKDTTGVTQQAPMSVFNSLTTNIGGQAVNPSLIAKSGDQIYIYYKPLDTATQTAMKTGFNPAALDKNYTLTIPTSQFKQGEVFGALPNNRAFFNDDELYNFFTNSVTVPGSGGGGGGSPPRLSGCGVDIGDTTCSWDWGGGGVGGRDTNTPTCSLDIPDKPSWIPTYTPPDRGPIQCNLEGGYGCPADARCPSDNLCSWDTFANTGDDKGFCNLDWGVNMYMAQPDVKTIESSLEYATDITQIESIARSNNVLIDETLRQLFDEGNIEEAKAYILKKIRNPNKSDDNPQPVDDLEVQTEAPKVF